MADRPFVISEILCFLLNKYGSSPSKMLKQIIINYCDYSDIIIAKDLILKDMLSLNLDKTPYFPCEGETV